MIASTEHPGAVQTLESLDEIIEENKDDISFHPTKSIVPAPTLEPKRRLARRLTSTKIITVE